MDKIIHWFGAFMAIIICIMGLVLLLTNEAFSNFVPQQFRTILGLIWLAYGSFRIYRISKTRE